MFISNTVLRELKPDERPIQAGMIGAGYMARGIALPKTRLCDQLRDEQNRVFEKELSKKP